MERIPPTVEELEKFQTVIAEGVSLEDESTSGKVRGAHIFTGIDTRGGILVNVIRQDYNPDEPARIEI